MLLSWAAPCLAVEVEPSTFASRMQLRGSDALPTGGVEDVTVPVDLGRIAGDYRVVTPIFVDEDQRTVLPHEVETDGARTVYWVHMPELGPGEPLWVYWDSSEPPSPPPPGPLWPQALGVWHLTGSTDCSACVLELDAIEASPGGPGVWGDAYNVSAPLGALQVTGPLPVPMTVSTWILLDQGAFTGHVLTLEFSKIFVDRCPIGPLAVRLVVGGVSSDCLPVELDVWTYYAVTVGPDGYTLTVDDQRSFVPARTEPPPMLGVVPVIGAQVDELRVHEGERDPLLLHLDWRSGLEDLFVFDHSEEVVTVPGPTPSTGDTGQESTQPLSWARARWSGGCETGAGAGTRGALVLLALLCARRSRP
jgi:hypothetical protein